MRQNHLKLTFALALLLPLAVASRPASAAGAADLKSPYSVTAFQVNREGSFGDAFTLTSAGGTKVTGNFAGVPIKGKLTNKGKLTFSGHAEVKITDGKGQLSATGLFILGSFKITAGGEPESHGTYTFRALTDAAGLRPRVAARAVPISGLAAGYAGGYHDNSVSDNEDENVGLSNIVEGANGKFTAVVLDVPVTGKRTGNKVAFKGSLKNSTVKLQGGGTLDFTHQVIIGKFSFSGAPVKISSGKGTIEIYAIPP